MSIGVKNDFKTFDEMLNAFNNLDKRLENVEDKIIDLFENKEDEIKLIEKSESYKKSKKALNRLRGGN